LIKHKIDLFAAGLEYNPGAGVSLADSREALLQYRSNLDSLCPIEERTVESPWEGDMGLVKTAGGVCAIVKGGSVRLVTLGSASRGIPNKEWEIPAPVANQLDYCFYPGADVIAFVNLQESGYVCFSWGQHRRLILMGQPQANRNKPENHFGWRKSSCCSMPNNSLLAKKRHHRLLLINNKLQACGSCEAG
jgi:hypothetical protein